MKAPSSRRSGTFGSLLLDGPFRPGWRSRIWIISLFLVTSFNGCEKPPQGPGELRGAASIAPLADLLQTVAGNQWKIESIVPPGISAHVFEPTPSDAARLSRVRLVATVGGGYDPWIARMVEACASRARIVNTSGVLGLSDAGHESGEDEHGHGHDHSAENDPHWWLSPSLTARVLPALAEGLAAAHPEGREGYISRARELGVQIERLDREIEERLAPVKGRGFVSAHPAWTHFAARYGLRQAGSIEPAPGRDPSPWEIRKLVDEAQSGGFSVLFTEPQFSRTAAEAIAADAGLGLAMVDPIGGVPGRGSYLEMMRFNSRVFATGLKAKGESR